jgi:hypothetical protein
MKDLIVCSVGALVVILAEIISAKVNGRHPDDGSAT